MVSIEDVSVLFAASAGKVGAGDTALASIFSIGSLELFVGEFGVSCMKGLLTKLWLRGAE
jgi:hypothetical protein